MRLNWNDIRFRHIADVTLSRCFFFFVLFCFVFFFKHCSGARFTKLFMTELIHKT